jgi:hypothetical protein
MQAQQASSSDGKAILMQACSSAADSLDVYAVDSSTRTYMMMADGKHWQP